ncbi:hypothetical protein CBG25_14420 [Arsenophonus sp. ENCA]|uniref:helix-turn-helix domain-containing protein n=1 Tax=Arsenophonus sp. ENCA TaxID=1987579 RepID=UPI000BCA53BB|nr:helix-turn-helix domain-containing protein [Arsenophonus sp. ENCA]PAV01836.1 hypothetical protein CBG25_14420 [Arsenophonus sp. ENCA]
MSETTLLPASSRARRVLRILKALKGHGTDGLSNGDLARLLKENPTNISRTLPLMIEEGMIEKRPTGHYALGQEFLLIAMAYLDASDRSQVKLTELKQRCFSSR